MKEGKTYSNLFGVFLVLLLAFFALGFYTFYNAKGISYFSNDSEACNNCHIMNDVYADYLKGPHSKKIAGQPKASCNDCHLPHNFVDKWIAKAQSGVGHAYAFTAKLNELPTHLSANPKSQAMVQENCMRCHSEMVANVISATTNPHSNNALKCVSCHQDAGHKRGF